MDAFLKLAHARRQLREIEKRIRFFLARKPYGMAIDYDFDTGKWRDWIAVLHEPPRRIGLVIGDYVYALRSSLDQLAWELAKRHSGTAPTNTEFPVFKDEPKYVSSGRRKIAALPPEARAAIEFLQPYNAGDGTDRHPLWVLHCLSNIDKHRFLHVAQGRLLALDYTITEGEISMEYEREPGPIEEGADLLRGISKSDCMNVKVDPTFGVTFDKGSPVPGELVIPTLRELFFYVRNDIFGHTDLKLP